MRYNHEFHHQIPRFSGRLYGRRRFHLPGMFILQLFLIVFIKTMFWMEYVDRHSCPLPLATVGESGRRTVGRYQLYDNGHRLLEGL